MKHIAVGPILFTFAMVVACANSASLGEPSQEVEPSPSFTPPGEDGGDITPPTMPLLCAETECEAPYATCPTSRWRCATNLDNDVKNCGGCGITCPPEPNAAEALHMTFSCEEGQCVAKCETSADFSVRRYANCNGLLDDGCEVLLGSKNHCGACGDACEGDLQCINGKCGCQGVGFVPSGTQCVCAAGLTECLTPWGSKECADATSSDSHCGACGNRCTNTGPVPDRPNTYYGCLNSACDTPKCYAGYFDCDGKEENGCESLVNSDPKNCGACGNACDPGQQCFRGECVCKTGTFCGNSCVDLTTDPVNCGRCDNKCPGMRRQDASFWSLPSPNGGPSCTGGRCDYTCEAGWADCDQDIQNGCEADILTNPYRCGGCNIKCDVEAGQVCVRGKCATRECKEGEIR